jgi:hypothetical protein
MIFHNVNLVWLTCIQNLEVPLHVAIKAWFNNIQTEIWYRIQT